ncbi:hypothetical protein C8R45DRAFT_790575, partial [Mycena sanguinolenta]
FWLGPWLIGSCLELVLMGVLSCQFVNYYNSSRNDGRGLRIAVAILCLLNVLKSVECFASLWIFLLDHFGDIQYDFQLSTTGWWVVGTPLMVAILDFYVQCYFCTRLWAVSQRWWVCAPIFTLFVFALVSMIIAVRHTSRSSLNIMAAVDSNYCRPIAGDLILSGTTAYFLIRTEQGFLSKQMTELVHSLIPLTFQTATPPAVVALFNLIFSQMDRTGRPLLGFVEIAFNQVLPKLYAISMMYTLNSRRGIRSSLPSSGNASSGAE